MATYYIDPDTGVGAGTVDDPADPYEFHSDIPVTSNGDFVKFKRGTTHSTTSWVSPENLSDLTYEAYYNTDGTDDTSQPKPIIINTTSGGNAFQVNNTTNRLRLTVRNLVCRDSVGGSARNMNLATSDYTVDSGILIEDCEFYNAAQQNVRIMGGGVTLRNCILDGADDDNLYSEGDLQVVEGCTMTNPGRTGPGDNIQHAQSQHTPAVNCVWKDNHLDANGSTKQCIIVGGNTHRIEGNTCIAGNNGINLSTATSDIVVAGNEVIAGTNTDRGISNEGDDNFIWGNLVNHEGATDSSVAAIFNATAANPVICNNTIIGRSDVENIVLNSTATNAIVKNNISINGETGISHSIGGITESNNVLYNNGTNVMLTPASPQTPDATDILTDPLLDADYKPISTSPCYQAGTFVSFNARDYRGRPYTTPPSIGAFNMTSSGDWPQDRTDETARSQATARTIAAARTARE